MIDVPVYRMSGEQVGTKQIDPDLLGGKVRPQLLKQALVRHMANQRQGNAATKSRSMVEGSTRKLYRQKGTGNARAGNIRTPVRRGGGRTFAKRNRDMGLDMPKRMRRLANANAILAKVVSHNALIIDDLHFDTPKTKPFAAMLKAVNAGRGAIVALGSPNEATYRSGRNIPKVEIGLLKDFNAYQFLRREKLIMTPEAFDWLTTRGPVVRTSAAKG